MVSVNFQTADGDAKAKSDYQSTSGTLTFAPGETSKTISVAVKGDKTVEPEEWFYVNLSDASGADILDGQGIGMIAYDDFADDGCHDKFGRFRHC